MQVDWHGVYPASTTQFHDDESLDLEATGDHLDRMIESGIHGVIMLGTVGENCSLEYEEKLQALRQELEETQRNIVGKWLDTLENNVQEQVQERLRGLEGELVEFAAEAAIRLVNGLPISTEILEASILDALKHCENDIEVSVHLNPADLKMLKESESELLSDSPHQRRVRYLKDEEVSRGGCLVETRCGVIDGRRETREKLLMETVKA